MLSKAKSLLILTFFALLTLTSCENEIVDINLNNQDTIAPNSSLANLMLQASANDGSVDDILDNANCLSVNLPVTISINGLQLTINTLDDLELIEAIYNEYEGDDDVLDFLFPITITLNDYTQFVINNQDELETFINECNEVDEVIECIDFQYPISFSIYNANFQVTDTVVIESDQALHEFLQGLENSNNGAVLASLNFPVTMVYANGETLEVSNNQELEAAINAAEDDCDGSNDCTEEQVDMYLQECYWRIVAFNGDDNFIQYEFHFNDNGNLQIIDGVTTVAIGGNWSTSQSNQGVVVTLSELTAFSQDLGGDWLVVACGDDRLELVRTTANNSITIVLEQECDTNVNNCNMEEVYNNLLECHWFAGTNLFNNVIGDKFYFNENNALVAVNPVSNDELIGTWDLISTNDGLIMVINMPQPYDIISLNWLVVECSNNRIEMHNGDNYLVFEQSCETDNPFACFGTFDAEIVLCDGDNNDGSATFDLTQAYANCIQPDNHIVTYHISHADAETGINALPNPTSYSNLSNPQTIYVRVQLNGNNNFAIFEIGLFVENCNNANCTEEEINNYLLECIWNVVNYNGSNDLIVYDFNFNNDGTVTIIGNGITINSMWSTSTSANGVIVEFSNVAGPNIQAITGNWTVVECQNNRLQFVRNNDTMVMERTCN